MSLRIPHPSTPGAENIGRSFAGLRSLPSVHWPNDCHLDGTRMQFVFTADDRISHRVCPKCGATARAVQGLRGVEIILSEKEAA